MDLLRDRAADAVEEMDLPGCDPGRLDRTYAQFAMVNRAVSGWRGIYRTPAAAPAVRGTRRPPCWTSAAAAGTCRCCSSRWAARDGLRLEITAIDPDPRASRFAASGTRARA